MRLSRKSEYACLALITLARSNGKHLCTAEMIAKENAIPKKFLEQILSILKREGYVKAKRGIDGGYSLARPPKQITLAQIVRLIDGALAPVGSASVHFYEPSPSEHDPRLLRVFKDIRGMIAQKLEQTTLADLTS